MSSIPAPSSIDTSPAAAQPPPAEYEGYCAVAVSMGEKVASDPSSLTRHAGRTFRFSSAEAKAMFDADPVAFTVKADAAWPRLS